jgi:hypothetical protein
MDAPSLSSQTGFRVPSWVIPTLSAAATAVATLIAIGIAMGSKLEAQAQQNDNVNYRLCRIERALKVDPWISCPSPDFRSNAVPSR